MSGQELFGSVVIGDGMKLLQVEGVNNYVGTAGPNSFIRASFSNQPPVQHVLSMECFSTEQASVAVDYINLANEVIKIHLLSIPASIDTYTPLYLIYSPSESVNSIRIRVSTSTSMVYLRNISYKTSVYALNPLDTIYGREGSEGINQEIRTSSLVPGVHQLYDPSVSVYRELADIVTVDPESSTLFPGTIFSFHSVRADGSPYYIPILTEHGCILINQLPAPVLGEPATLATNI